MTSYKDLPTSVGKTVSLLGWVDSIKEQKKRSFMMLRMGPMKTIQVLTDRKGITAESFVRVTGLVSALPPKAYSILPVEIHATDIEVLSAADSSFSMQCPPDAGSEVRLEKRHLYLRDPTFVLITQCRAHLLRAFRAHFESTDCTEIVPPSFTGVECEGGATLFKVEHPGVHTDKPMTAFLTQSSQFALEMAVPAHGDCYCIAPSFRAEKSHTRRHFTEFVHAEAEWVGVLTMDDHLAKLRSLLQGIIHHYLIFAEIPLKKLGKYDRVVGLKAMADDILILDHKDAIAKCTELGIMKDDGTPFAERDDIPEMQERKLIDTIGKIVFLVRFPKEFKSFYMGLDPEDSSRVLGCDVEVPGVGEIIGSGVREADHDRLYARLMDFGLKPDDYREYLDLRKYGFGMTSGMGAGLDRVHTWFLDAHSIRDVATFPRFPGYLRP